MTHKVLKTALIASAATLLLAAGPKADLNQDGQVTKAEYMEAAQTYFASVDANSDGFLSEDERQALRTAAKSDVKDKIFNKLDTDGDGSVSRAEMEAAGEKVEARKAESEARKQRLMERYDTNVDGDLSDAEKTVMKAELGSNNKDAKNKDAKNSDRTGDRKNRTEGSREKRGDRLRTDANEDGVVSLAEHIAVAERLFTRLDANDDGILTEGEGRQRGKRDGKRGR